LGKIADQKDANGNLLYTLEPTSGNPATVAFPTATGGTANVVFTMTHDLVTKNVDQLGRTTTFTYSASGAGFLTTITDPMGYVTQISPSAFGNPLSITNPDGTTKTWTRDDLDLPLTATDELGHTTTFTRDTNHRVTQVTYVDGSSESFAYNAF
jgi:YD repeat-containing protein